jgi:DNA-directed RNA polymerase specialized sigma24 family protein
MNQSNEAGIMSAADLDAIRKGNEFVLRKVYKEHYSLIRKLVVANKGDEDDARDIYQEAFIVFYENMRTDGFELTCGIGTRWRATFGLNV